MRTKRLALTGASLVLLGGMMTACGGGSGSDAPTNASKEDFCEAYKAVNEAEEFDDGRDAVDDLKDVGTPEDIPDDARNGFEVLIDAVSDLKDEDDEIDDSDYTDEEQENVGAFLSWVSTYC
ncbi:hypothetical protein [Nocardioides sp. AE5]|uniref:hypothetical protein n=1 Tax=Nocardioides sp. AE5 TaxID=2962573 RepID=UPI0028827490|nr:hypothetical protein [Nocardioides sp. AE5]MDT0202327.1 hypothetical protein [Nocardioides sp. AE5]